MAEGFVYDGGEIEATATINRDEFNEMLDRMKADIDEFTSTVYSVKFDADSNLVQASIDDMDVQASELTDRDWELMFGADTADAQMKFDFLNAQVDELERPIEIPIHVSDDLAMAKIAELNTALEATTANMERMRVEMQATIEAQRLQIFDFGEKVGYQENVINGLAADLEEADARISAAAAGIKKSTKDVEHDLTDLQGGWGSTGNAFSGLSWMFKGPNIPFLPDFLGSFAGLLTIGPSIIALIQGLSFAVGGMTTMFSIAAVGTVAFAAIAYPAIEKVMSAISAGTQLTGPLGQLETAVKGLEKGWDQLEQVADPSVFSALTYSLQQLDQILPSLAPLFVEAGQGFQAFMAPIFQGMESPDFTQFISWLAAVATPVAGAFGSAVANIASAWAGWMEAFGPALPALEKGLKDVTKDWSNFANGLSNSPGWASFLTNGQKDLGQLGILVGNLGNAIGQLFISTGPSGPTGLSALNTGLEAIGKLLTPLIGPLATLGSGLLTDLADFLKGLSGRGEKATKHLGTLITQLGVDAKKSGPDFKRLGKDVGDFFDTITGGIGPFTSFLNLATDGPMKASKAWRQWMTSSSKAFNTWIKSIPGDMKVMWNDISTGVGKALKYIGDSFEPMGAWFAWLWSTIINGANKWLQGTAGPWFHALPGTIVAKLGDPGTMLLHVGEHIILGLMSGVESWWSGTAEPWFEALPKKIVGALGDVGSILLAAGKAIINGLLTGLKDAWKDVTSFVGGIGAWIADHKGPLDYDRQLLVPHGEAIMQGLAQGLQTGLNGPVALALGRAASEVAGSFGGVAGARSLGVTVGASAGSGTVAAIEALGAKLGKKIDDLPRKYQLVQRTA